MKWSKILFNCKRDSRITQKIEFFQNFQMTPKMFLDIVGFITTSKISILKTFQGGGSWSPPSCQIGLRPRKVLLSFEVSFYKIENLIWENDFRICHLKIPRKIFKFLLWNLGLNVFRYLFSFYVAIISPNSQEIPEKFVELK